MLIIFKAVIINTEKGKNDGLSLTIIGKDINIINCIIVMIIKTSF